MVRGSMHLGIAGFGGMGGGRSLSAGVSPGGTQAGPP